MIESLLENTISNVLTEALNKEFSLTSRPRLIALPPKSIHGSNTLMSSTNQLTKKNTLTDNASITTPVSPTLSVTKSIDMMSNIIKTEPLF